MVCSPELEAQKTKKILRSDFSNNSFFSVIICFNLKKMLFAYRNNGVGAAFLMDRFVGIVAPYIIFLVKLFLSLPHADLEYLLLS